jgi:Glycosidases
MRQITVLHDSSREYVYPSARNILRLKLKYSYDQVAACKVVFWNRFRESEIQTAELKCAGKDEEFFYCTCELTFHEAARYIRYYFIIETGSGSLYFGRDGLCREKPEYFFEYLYTNEDDIINVPQWARGAVMYQIFPERFKNGNELNDPVDIVDWNSLPTRENFFGGDLRGIIIKLDYLKGLGIDAIYLNPLFKAHSNHKYDTTDYYAIDDSFGDIDDLKELVSECHSRNIRVLLDGVFNHCGYYFPQFQDVLEKGAASGYKDWFYIESFPVQTDPPNYECVGYYKWMPKLRFKNPEVRQYFIDVGTYWLKAADIDGWRLDVADEVDFTFWQEFKRAVKSVKQDALLLAETWKDGHDLLRGDQMDSVMNYLFRDAVVDYFAKGAIDTWRFGQLIHKMLFLYPEAVNHVLYNLLGSHDTPRFLSLCNGSIPKLKLAVAFQMTFPGMPAIYYGDETGLVGDNDPDCRRTMNWDSQNEELLDFYRKMICIRKESPCLIYGDYRSIYCDEDAYGFARHFNRETAYVIINNSGTYKTFEIPLFEDIHEISEMKSIIEHKSLKPMQIQAGDSFYNSDIHNYHSKFKMILPAYHFEILVAFR